MASFYLPHAASAAARRERCENAGTPDFNNMHYIIETKSEKVNADGQKRGYAHASSFHRRKDYVAGVKSKLKNCGGKTESADGGFYHIRHFMRKFRHIKCVCLHKFGEGVPVLVAHHGDYADVSEALSSPSHGCGAHPVGAHRDGARGCPRRRGTRPPQAAGRPRAPLLRSASIRAYSCPSRAVEGAVDKGGEMFVVAQQAAHFGDPASLPRWTECRNIPLQVDGRERS